MQTLQNTNADISVHMVYIFVNSQPIMSVVYVTNRLQIHMDMSISGALYIYCDVAHKLADMLKHTLKTHSKQPLVFSSHKASNMTHTCIFV